MFVSYTILLIERKSWLGSQYHHQQKQQEQVTAKL